VVVCSQCGCENLPKDKFCGECGHKFSLPSEASPKDLSFDEKLKIASKVNANRSR
jgi:uncharacterized membrane protein YvbJ